VNNRGCYLTRIGYTDCDGPLDAAHLAPKQRLKALYKTRGMPAHQIAAAVWDARVTVPICRRHHTLFDQKVIRLTEDQFPPKMLEYAAEYGLEYRGARDGWVGLHVPPETGSAA
jgi:hypothetical protein